MISFFEYINSNRRAVITSRSLFINIDKTQ